jgi:hypothetical protein
MIDNINMENEKAAAAQQMVGRTEKIPFFWKIFFGNLFIGNF